MGGHVASMIPTLPSWPKVHGRKSVGLKYGRAPLLAQPGSRQDQRDLLPPDLGARPVDARRPRGSIEQRTLLSLPASDLPGPLLPVRALAQCPGPPHVLSAPRPSEEAAEWDGPRWAEAQPGKQRHDGAASRNTILVGNPSPLCLIDAHSRSSRRFWFESPTKSM